MSFRAYLLHGWKLCALRPGFKAPQGAASKGWNRKERAISDPAQGAALAGAGLCHAWSGTCALDVDHLDHARDWLHDNGIDLDDLLAAPESVHISSGRPGRAKLLYLLPAPLASVKVAPYQVTDPATSKSKTYHALEFRCATADGLTVQDVLPPSIHPGTGRPYVWRYGDDMLGSWQLLPPLPAPLRALWVAHLEEVSRPVGPVAPAGVELRELRELLDTYDPDESYDTWLKLGMMLHHETRGSSDALALWDEWSRRGSKYGVSSDGKPAQFPADKWRTFRLDTANPVTIGSMRRDAIARIEDFPLVTTHPPQASKEDTRPSAVVARLLEPRLVFVRGQDRYFDLDARGESWLSDRSIRHLFCPHMPSVRVEGKNGKPDKVVTPDPVDHMMNSKTKTVVDVVGLHPGEGRLYREDGKAHVNRFVRVDIKPLAPRAYEQEAFAFLWSRIVDPVVRRWLMKFYAHALQKPGVKIQTAPLLFSAATGTGKNTLAKTIPELMFGTQWVRTMSGNVLGGQFNDVVGETWWLYLEELRSGTTKADRVHISNKIKAWITDHTIEVHPKGLKPYDIRNRLQLTATSNFYDALQLDNNDRRWVVGELGDPLTEREATDLYGFLNSPRAPGVLRHIFGEVNLTGFSPTARAPVTASKTTMIRAGIGQWESSIIERMVNNEPPFQRDVFSLRDVHQELIGSGPTSLHSLRNVLRQPPFNCHPLPNSSKVRLWAWRNIDGWLRSTEGERLKHLETGERLPGMTAEVPEALQVMSADASDSPLGFDVPDSCKDLI